MILLKQIEKNIFTFLVYCKIFFKKWSISLIELAIFKENCFAKNLYILTCNKSYLTSSGADVFQVQPIDTIPLNEKKRLSLLLVIPMPVMILQFYEMVF